MTPAEELTAAADKLDGLIAGATQDWSHMDDVESQLFPEDLAYIAAMNPLVGKALVGLMRTLATEYERETRHFHAMWNDAARERMVGDKWPGFAETLSIARLINGSAE